MRKYFGVLLVLLVVTSCSVSIHTIDKGDLKIEKKEFYIVSYNAVFTGGLEAKVEYINDDLTLVKSSKILGSFNKTVKLKTGTRVQFNCSAKGTKGKGIFKVTVDGEIINEYTLVNKKLKYGVAFDLP